MLNSLVGTLVFSAVYIATSYVLFDWTPRTQWPQYLLSGMLFLLVTEILDRKRRKSEG